ncbi:MAG: signal peptide prediction [Thiomonas sp. 20-64-5]|nr:MAG: signal peptide prediction [Thiomonas sp. 20-64-5]
MCSSPSRWSHPSLAGRLLWAAPYSLLGLLIALPACVLGARLQRRDHTLECTGGRLARWVLRLPNRHRIVAITLGHVILAVNVSAMQQLRAHERVHVRQYEHWGPFFGLAYLLESLWQTLRGRDAYRANRFEREAYAKGGPFTP